MLCCEKLYTNGFEPARTPDCALLDILLPQWLCSYLLAIDRACWPIYGPLAGYLFNKTSAKWSGGNKEKEHSKISDKPRQGIELHMYITTKYHLILVCKHPHQHVFELHMYRRPAHWYQVMLLCTTVDNVLIMIKKHLYSMQMTQKHTYSKITHKKQCLRLGTHNRAPPPAYRHCPIG